MALGSFAGAVRIVASLYCVFLLEGGSFCALCSPPCTSAGVAPYRAMDEDVSDLPFCVVVAAVGVVAGAGVVAVVVAVVVVAGTGERS